MKLYPRLNTGYAKVLAAEHAGRTVDELTNWISERSPFHRPNTEYAATGGVRVSDDELVKLRNKCIELARDHGFPEDNDRDQVRQFEFELTKVLVGLEIIPAEAARDEVWQYMTCVLVPDVVGWRWRSSSGSTSEERYLGGIRNALQRLYVRGLLLRYETSGEPWRFIDPNSPLRLGEDQVVQIVERTALSGHRDLCHAILRTWEIHGDAIADTDITIEELFRGAMKHLVRRLAYTLIEALETEETFDVAENSFIRALSDLGVNVQRTVPEQAHSTDLEAMLPDYATEIHANGVREYAELDASELSANLNAYFRWLRTQAKRHPHCDIELASEIAEGLQELLSTVEIEAAPEMLDALRGVVHYFMSTEDSIKYYEPDGFEDDREVFNALAKFVGKPHLVIASSPKSDEVIFRVRDELMTYIRPLMESELRPLDELQEMLRNHVAQIRHFFSVNRTSEAQIAEAIAHGYGELIEYCRDTRPSERFIAGLQSGILYFTEVEDAIPDDEEGGLDDDAEVYCAVLEYFGRDDLLHRFERIRATLSSGMASEMVFRELRAIDLPHYGSNQHEIQGVSDLRELFGEQEREMVAEWIWVSSKRILRDTSKLTWYDARRSHPTRTEWRLYYGDNEIIERAHPDDVLVVIYPPADLNESDCDVLLVVLDRASGVSRSLLSGINPPTKLDASDSVRTLLLLEKAIQSVQARMDAKCEQL